jgi:hypothetical protein
VVHRYGQIIHNGQIKNNIQGVYLNTKVFIVGGSKDIQIGNSVRDVDMFDLNTLTLTKATHMKTPRSNFGMAINRDGGYFKKKISFKSFQDKRIRTFTCVAGAKAVQYGTAVNRIHTKPMSGGISRICLLLLKATR